MAEVVGIVLGVVPIGLEAFTSLRKYFDGVRCQPEDIASIVRESEAMKTRLEKIDALQNQFKHSSIVCDLELQETMTTAKADLRLLNDYIQKISAGDGPVISNSVTAKISAVKKKLSFPFRKDHIERLEIRLAKANKSLHDGLQLISLYGSTDAPFPRPKRRPEGQRTDYLSRQTDYAFQQETRASLGIITQHLSRMRMEFGTHSTPRTAYITPSATEGITATPIMQLTNTPTEDNSRSPSDLLHVAQRIAATPSRLKEACDFSSAQLLDSTDHSALQIQLSNSTSSFSETTLSKGGSFGSFCRCSARRTSRRNKRSFGRAFIMKESVIERAHLPDCPYATFDTSMISSWSAGLSMRSFNTLLSAAFTLTFTSTSGAGGFAISPTISYANMREQSPALQVIRILQVASHFTDYDRDQVAELTQRAVEALKTTFMKRTSSLSDVDERGDNLLHFTLGHTSGRGFRSEIWSQTDKIASYLVHWGVPVDQANHDGRFPFQESLEASLDSESDSSLVLTAFDTLCPKDSIIDFDIVSHDDEQQMLQRMFLHQAINQNSAKLAIFYEGHPLEAIFTQNKVALLDMLRRESSLPSLSSVGAFGDTCLTHLIGWEEGLSIILARFGKPFLQEHDVGPITALGTALYWSGQLCDHLPTSMCSEECRCTAVVKLLLKTDSDCVQRTITQLGNGRRSLCALRKASWRARGLVIDELRSRRQKLKELALEWLGPTQIDRFALNQPQILDQYTGEVIEALKSRGCKLPSPLLTAIPHPNQGWISLYQLISHHWSNSTHVADMFFSKGFQDVDCPDNYGCTPLAISEDTRFSAWLLEHGASLQREVPSGTAGTTVAHFIFWNIRSWDYDYPPHAKLLRIIRDLPPARPFLDDCVCGCSINGCHPYTNMWKKVSCGWNKRGQRRLPLKSLGRAITKHCNAISDGWEIPPGVRSLFIRACTFAALPLRHTCCHLDYYDPEGDESTSLEDWEVQELREEDAEGLALLDTLVSEFEEKVCELNCPLVDFFETYWMRRMTEVQQDIKRSKMTRRNITGAEKAGVSWHTYSGPKEKAEKDDVAADFGPGGHPLPATTLSIDAYTNSLPLLPMTLSNGLRGKSSVPWEYWAHLIERAVE